MQKEYLIIGDNNFWYAALTDKKHIKDKIKEIENKDYGLIDEIPSKLYVYEDKCIDEVELE